MPNTKPCSFESPVKRLLHTNLVPTPHECMLTEHVLVEPRRELARLDEEITHMEQNLSDLKHRREDLAADIDAHLALMSPVRRLPEDALREIFISSLPSTHNAIISSREAPLLLCHVCSGWRSIALSTPRLWTSLHIVVPDEPRLKDILFLAKRWISRSGVLPLSLSIAISACLADSEAASAAPLLSVLAEVSNRWQAVEFTTPDYMYQMDWFSQPLSALTPDGVPNLKTVTFGCNNPDVLSTPFLASPGIHSLSLYNIPSSIDAASISWHSLTRLELGSSYAKDSGPWSGHIILEILRRCVNLETCTLVIMSSDPELITDDSVTLPHLTSLRVACYDHTIGGLLFQRMRLPALTCLESIEFMASLISMSLFPTTGTLRELSIQGIFSQRSLHQMLAFRMFPSSLETLRITTSKTYLWEGTFAVDDAVLRLIGPPHFPALNTLEINGCSELTDTELLSYIRGRADDGAPLQRLSVVFERPMEEDILPHLADLISAGLLISLVYDADFNRGQPDLPPYHPWEGTDVVD
ncbi:hypothetical protein C8R43DRAFT_997237 [Mycena crocata]|nr:hypothetical protein C8R43DRAFT_997237 [Mycena crocata]